MKPQETLPTDISAEAACVVADKADKAALVTYIIAYVDYEAARANDKAATTITKDSP